MNRLLTILVMIAALFSGHTLALAEGKTKVVDAEGKAEISAGRTPDEARRLALDRARRAALEEAVGVDVRGSTVVYNADLINDMVMTGTGGLITGQDILLNECGEEEGRLVCTILIRAEVSILDSRKDAPFRIKASVLRPGTKAKKDVVLFQDGDEVIVKVRLDRKGYVSIFGVDQAGSVSQLFPNKYSPDSLLDAEEEFVFPDDKLRERGLKLRAKTLAGKRKTNESIMIIATTKKVSFLEDAGDGPLVTDLMSELAALDNDVWAQITRGYIILK
ncbi:DUF4384 domain-containing protein [Nitrospirota bacterium]